MWNSALTLEPRAESPEPGDDQINQLFTFMTDGIRDPDALHRMVVLEALHRKVILATTHQELWDLSAHIQQLGLHARLAPEVARTTRQLERPLDTAAPWAAAWRALVVADSKQELILALMHAQEFHHHPLVAEEIALTRTRLRARRSQT